MVRNPWHYLLFLNMIIKEKNSCWLHLFSRCFMPHLALGIMGYESPSLGVYHIQFSTSALVLMGYESPLLGMYMYHVPISPHRTTNNICEYNTKETDGLRQ